MHPIAQAGSWSSVSPLQSLSRPSSQLTSHTSCCLQMLKVAVVTFASSARTTSRVPNAVSYHSDHALSGIRRARKALSVLPS